MQPSTVQYSPVQSSTAQDNPLQPTTAKYSPVKLSTAQYSQVQPSTAKYSPVQLSTAKYSPLQPSRAQYSPVQSITPHCSSVQPSCSPEHSSTARHPCQRCQICYPIFPFRNCIVYFVLFLFIVDVFHLCYRSCFTNVKKQDHQLWEPWLTSEFETQ